MLYSPLLHFPSLHIFGSTSFNCLDSSLVPAKMCFLLHLPFLGIQFGQLQTNPSQPEAEISNYHTLESKNKALSVKEND